jgi:hypothetical protein
MTGSDDEFDDFLRRRKPVFRRSTDDPFEPPEELDRIVLRQAREAIEGDRPDKVYHGPRWGMPVALAASLLLVFSVILHFAAQREPAPVAEVTVQTISQEFEYPMAAPAPAPSGGFASEAESARYAPVPPPPPVASTSRADPAPAGEAAVTVAPPSEADRAVASATSTPAWRRDAAAWRAEIARLRAAGKVAEADAEQAEYQRQHRAYAGAPDR